MKKIIIALAVALLGGCSDDKSTSVEKPVTDVAPAQPVATIEVPKAPAAPIHNYSLEEDGEYGYEGAISENDKNNGVAASKVLMFRYLGEKNGTYTVQIKDGNVSQLTSCKAPCDFVKNKRYFAGQLVGTETMRAGDASIIHAVLEDAQNGFLKQYQASVKQENTATITAPVKQGADNLTANESATDIVPMRRHYPSFNCNLAKSTAELLICGDDELSALDSDLLPLFTRAKLMTGDRNEFTEESRRAWNWREKNCSDKACLVNWYTERKNFYTAAVASK